MNVEGISSSVRKKYYSDYYHLHQDHVPIEKLNEYLNCRFSRCCNLFPSILLDERRK